MTDDQDYAALADHLAQTHTVGRYILHRQIARGGMATIHIARLMGDEGFSRIVAAKRLHPEFAEDSEFVAMFLDEARIASKVHHRNVVPVLDVVTTQDEVLLVQEFVHGAPLHWLLNKTRMLKERIPVDIAVGIASQVLAGLHAAHELVDEMGMPLHVVHRDVSPQNVMIATDGTARLLDFGVAKASMAAHTTREGTYKGKLAYSAPEQLRGRATKQSDIYALAVVLWELCVGHRMHGAQSETELVATIMAGKLPTIAETLAPEREWATIGDDTWAQIEAVDSIVHTGLAADASRRYQTAQEMEEALVRAVAPAQPSAIATWVKQIGKDYLEKHERLIAAEEASWRRTKGSMVGSLPRAGTRLRTQPGIDSISRVSAHGAHTLPPAPVQPKSRTTMALLAAVVTGAAVVLVLMWKGPAAESAKAAGTTAPTTAPATTERTERPAPSAPAAEPAPAPAPAAAAAIAQPEPSDESPRETDKTVAPAKRAVRQQVARQPAARSPKAAARVVEKQEAAAIVPPGTSTAAVAPAGDTKTDPKADCTPPYYYEGSKKIFKSACL